MAVEMGNSVSLIGACLVMLIHISSLAGTTHIVGGTTGWTTPSSSSFYSSRSAKQTFTIGDVLVFNFKTDQHTVAEVPKLGFKGCTTKKLLSIATTGPANITLKKMGTHCYLSTVPGDCNAGLKLDITVINLSAATSSPTPDG